jgi:hypothetical protein
MNLEAKNIFGTVPKQDYLNLWSDDKVDYAKIVKLVDLNKPDICQMTDVIVGRVRYDRQIPKAVRTRLEEIGNILNLVGQYFEGDAYKTALWFATKNPGLGNISPRDMIRLNRHDNLRNFVLAAREEAGWGDEK